ncbi:unnamed protein product [Zymoseptoria tritici ST99CH_1A5]|uniref:NADH:ubiquinone oxidoreductase intermediate-associated protein 30 domain-containing protein n=4 Tax=Zymoseptoria tritici TaxID=1047171 RepID=F9X0E3_ZYMTI|nr:uncharacterized protein MYCGRDRAFT_89822 [Zymoseptoria tritici IPO323]EGP91528.1 hypothetical protein MYCGRDRAFT_89822 [Zymoseptoria tritici IPO323]SMQ46423.1 unnamed protein product [Zymoseptoria tritici ST99CH_3D7]SMR42771.1 unnamed protein product [Zymoseptoria tritici ST99CH_1E4]SMY20107.1 unnamed protein product [Zymoseptoria tritici ST99CH_1A5]
MPALEVYGQKSLALFGGTVPWNANDWTSSDDRVRGGKSQSYLDVSDDCNIGRFHGNLDIKTLGGAGFASQRTTGEDQEWDLSDYAGIEICVAEGDKKRYTFNLKDSLLPPDPTTGREQSSLTYECDFELPPQDTPGHAHEKCVFIPWDSLNATYRGRVQKDAKPIDLESVKRISIMMRSFFGTQEGEFSLSIKSIAALKKVPKADGPVLPVPDNAALEKGSAAGVASYHRPRAVERAPMSAMRKVAFVLLGGVALMMFVGLRQPCGMSSNGGRK